MIWFTADTHFAHANIIRYCHRPFASVQEIDALLVERWNSTVAPGDTIYHLGDFTLKGIDVFAACAQKLNGRISILPGSHDHRWLSEFRPDTIASLSNYPVEVLRPLVSLEFPELGTGRYAQVIVLCHYAMRLWDRSHYGAWHLYGHSHGTLPAYGLSLDVGVDCHGYRPLSLEALALKLRGIQVLRRLACSYTPPNGG